MSRNREFQDRSLAALTAGKLAIDVPPTEGWPRYGISAVLPPEGPVVAELTAVRREAEAFTGPGQWRLDADTLHVTLRSLEPYSVRSFDGDERFAAYAAALARAASGFAPIELGLRGVAVHPGGVLMQGHAPQLLPELRRRFVAGLDARGVAHHESMLRDLWYLSLIQFAAPVADVPGLIAWGRANRDRDLGTVVLRRVELRRWWVRGGRLTTETLYVSKLDG